MPPKKSNIDENPYITCHVLDTITGKPAANVSVQLRVLEPSVHSSHRWIAKTDEDGRVKAWSSRETVNFIETAALKSPTNENLIWELRFDTESYFGKGNTFFPAVTIMFATKMVDLHYHVPLLLGPWSYTTYRGS